ncbi:Phosphate starvation-inducible protein PhoH, predicted ATPase [Azospirillum argentinense]|uniref:PhoH family protein n=1 Tax=Azospirillum argentinense TaxID=2970906 RepID=UPI0032DFB839
MPKTPRLSRPVARGQRQEKKQQGRQALLNLVTELQGAPAPRSKAKEIVLEPKTLNQAAYDRAIDAHQMIFGLGPAGTGKTWWAVMRAAQAFKAKEIERIVCTRPAVESGDTLGYMPGDLMEKFAVYFQPVRDALEEAFGVSHVEYLIEQGRIEIRPLEYLRGATLKNAWVLADEMQNATVGQMEMFLTRIGDAKFILNGDPDQCDLKGGATSGLIDALELLEGTGGIGVVRFTEDDVVRSGLCGAIVKAYARRRREARAASLAAHEASNVARYTERDDDNDDTGLKRMLHAG